VARWVPLAVRSCDPVSCRAGPSIEIEPTGDEGGSAFWVVLSESLTPSAVLESVERGDRERSCFDSRGDKRSRGDLKHVA